MDKNIRDIYQLQLSQKDANMRARSDQSHFMYNTLEFIRMYAVMRKSRMTKALLSMSLVVFCAIISQMSEDDLQK